VYRGDVLESIGDFTTRIKLKFPKAAMLPVKVDPDESHFNHATDQFLQISKVSAGNTVKGDQNIMDVDQSEMMNGEGVCTSDMPHFVRSHRANNKVNVFWYTRPFRKRKEKSKNEFLDLWVEKKFLKTDEIMPCTQVSERSCGGLRKKRIIRATTKLTLFHSIRIRLARSPPPLLH